MSTARRRRATVLALVVALLVVPVAGGQLGGLAQEQVDPDTVVLQVELQADGDASWAVHYRTRLDDDNTTAAFESLQADVSADPTAYTADFGDRMNRTIATTENATGREMALRNLTVATETEALPQEYGVVTYRFEWTNFAAVEGDQLRAGDALSGLYLDEESTLRIDWPAGYERTSVDPSPTRSDEQTVAWDGRLDFESDEPRRDDDRRGRRGRRRLAARGRDGARGRRRRRAAVGQSPVRCRRWSGGRRRIGDARRSRWRSDRRGRWR